jgi:hypothetical protein
MPDSPFASDKKPAHETPPRFETSLLGSAQGFSTIEENAYFFIYFSKT